MGETSGSDRQRTPDCLVNIRCRSFRLNQQIMQTEASSTVDTKSHFRTSRSSLSLASCRQNNQFAGFT